ncbi:MAG: right-handed parallel beta-helix repeat-containing protein [Gemmatimonadetes bacterium]|nr:right-handed parallel beta-helix repeat-containing protein [Gemmatimonadota bacterium]
MRRYFVHLFVTAAAVAIYAGCGVATHREAVRVVRVAPDAPVAATSYSSTNQPSRLQAVLDTVRGPARILLAPGRYHLAAAAYQDPTCGNCEDPATAVPATLGMRVSGVGIEITGAHADSAIIHTRAGYGILFEDCDGCALRGVTVTGGVRDADGRATDGAVVVRRGTVALEACRIRDNIGDSATVASVVVGIAGAVGRENARIEVTGCRIERNSWDGIALYRDARATIRDNIIDGVNKASGGRVGGGRGVGIGLTWNAQADVAGNLVRRYWKGIGVFVDARANMRHNIVEDVLTWGIAYWGAGRGRAVAFIEENVVFETGACGVMLDRAGDAAGDTAAAAGSFVANVVVRTGQNPRYDSGEPYCTQRPVARENVPGGFTERNNLFHDNRQPGEAPREPELDAGAFGRAAAPLLERLRRFPALRESEFLRAFGSRRGTSSSASAVLPAASSKVRAGSPAISFRSRPAGARPPSSRSRRNGRATACGPTSW